MSTTRENPWDVRPKQPKGSASADLIFVKVGYALTVWESVESRMAELFDVLVATPPSNRAAFLAFASVKSSSARTELLEAAARRAIEPNDPAQRDVNEVITRFGKLGARRNEIAHGRVYDLGEHGFYLGPNNVMPHKWTSDGAAKYQYDAEDVSHYADCFASLLADVDAITARLASRAVDEASCS